MQDALNLQVHHQVHCDKQRCRARWAGHELISWPQSPPSPYASFMPHAPPTASVSLLPRQSTVRKARVFKMTALATTAGGRGTRFAPPSPTDPAPSGSCSLHLPHGPPSITERDGRVRRRGGALPSLPSDVGGMQCQRRRPFNSSVPRASVSHS